MEPKTNVLVLLLIAGFTVIILAEHRPGHGPRQQVKHRSGQGIGPHSRQKIKLPHQEQPHRAGHHPQVSPNRVEPSPAPNLQRPFHPRPPPHHPPWCKAKFENGTILRKHSCPPRQNMTCGLGPKQLVHRGNKIEVYACMPKPCKEVGNSGHVLVHEPCQVGHETCSVGPISLKVNGSDLNVTFCNHSHHQRPWTVLPHQQHIPVNNMETQMYAMLTEWNDPRINNQTIRWAYARQLNQLNKGQPPCRVVRRTTQATILGTTTIPCSAQTQTGPDNLCVIGPKRAIYDGQEVDAYYCKRENLRSGSTRPHHETVVGTGGKDVMKKRRRRKRMANA